MYQITESLLANKKQYCIKHIATGNYLSVIADYGGAVNQFVVNGKQILLGASNDTEFAQTIQKAFAGAQLFPFVNRINNGNYTINSKTYYLPQNDDAVFTHSLHGLVYDQPFSVVEIDEITGRLVLEYILKASEYSYPYEMQLQVTYTMEINSFRIDTIIKNLSNSPVPFAYGWHPYIAVSGMIDDCKLQLPSTKYFLTDNRLIPTGETKELKDFIEMSTIGSIDLNQCFEMPFNQKENTTMIVDTDGNRIKLTQYGFCYTQYYIPENRKSIAIEPQTSIPDAFNNGIGLNWLLPNETKSVGLVVSYELLIMRDE